MRPVEEIVQDFLTFRQHLIEFIHEDDPARFKSLSKSALPPRTRARPREDDERKAHVVFRAGSGFANHPSSAAKAAFGLIFVGLVPAVDLDEEAFSAFHR